MDSNPSFLARVLQLAQAFEYRQPLATIEECAERIKQLDRPVGDVYAGSTLAASATRSLMDDHRVFFSIVRQRRGRWSWRSDAELSGELTRDPLTDDVVAKGTVKINQDMAHSTWVFAALAVVLLAAGGLQQTWLLLFIISLAATSIYQAVLGIQSWIELHEIIRDIMNRPTAMAIKAKREAEIAAGDVLVDMTFNDPPAEEDDNSSLRQSR